MSKRSDKDKRAEYLEEHKSLTQSELQTSQLFDKSMLSLSSGALGLSITFIQTIAPKPSFTCILFLGWGAFIISLVCTLYSFITSQEACAEQRKINEAIYCENDSVTELINKSAQTTKCLNKWSIFSFIIGVILLTIFSAVNLHMGENNKMSKGDYKTKGFVPQTPPAPPKPPSDPSKSGK